MDKLINVLKVYAGLEELPKNCEIKIRRAELAPIIAYSKGKQEGQRALAVELLEIIKEINGNDK